MNQTDKTRAMIDVAGGIIRHQGKILICQRPQGKRLEYLWEFPGGKAEPGETMENCLKRELKEELDIQVFDIQPLKIIEDFNTNVRLHFYTCQLTPSADPVRLEHAALAWVDEHNFENYSFCPSDERLIMTTRPDQLFGSKGRLERDE